MKKLLAILLALMLVMVSAFALAADGEPDGNTEDPTTEVGNTEGGSTEGGSTGTTGGTSTGTINVTAAAVSVDTGYNTTTKTGGLNATEKQTIEVNKNFTVSGYGSTGKTPAHTLQFTVETGSVSNATTVTNADMVNLPVTINDLVLSEGQTTGTVKINLPAYTAVGVYTYPVTEVDTGVAGITYATGLELKVTVIQDGDDLKVAGIALKQGTTKTDTIENLYDAGSLKIDKMVTGNMGDRAQVWEFKVDFAAPTGDTVKSTIAVADTSTGKVTAAQGATGTAITSIAPGEDGWTTKTVYVYLTHGQSVEFDNLPAGVTYTVTESEDSNYTLTQKDEAGTIASAGLANAKFTNERDIPVDTGVTLETTAYMLIMALTMAGFAMMMIRRRKEY